VGLEDGAQLVAFPFGVGALLVQFGTQLTALAGGVGADVLELGPGGGLALSRPDALGLRGPGRGAGNNRAVSTATASSFLNAGMRAGGQRGRNGLSV
jgi:hypothetical protein